MYEIFAGLLKKHGITAYKVAKDLGIAQTTLSDWKRGRSTPKMEKMQKIADYFGVPLDTFYGKSESRAAAPEAPLPEDIIVVNRNGERVVRHLSLDAEDADMILSLIDKLNREKPKNGRL